MNAQSSFIRYRTIFLGWGFLLVALSVHALSVRSLPVQAQEVPVVQEELQQVVPSHISIPWKVNTFIEKGTWDGKSWSAPQDRAAFWQRGENTIIYGHNTRQILGNIRAMQGGEIITLEDSNGVEAFYKVTQFEEVSSDQTQWLEPTAKKVLTLYTCSGFWDKQRFVVRAELL
jgi:hypothetical protein